MLIFTQNNNNDFHQPISSIVSTIGIDYDTMKLAGGDITVWDFAGQLEYTASHQFFLSTEVHYKIVSLGLSTFLAEIFFLIM